MAINEIDEHRPDYTDQCEVCGYPKLSEKGGE